MVQTENGAEARMQGEGTTVRPGQEWGMHTGPPEDRWDSHAHSRHIGVRWGEPGRKRNHEMGRGRESACRTLISFEKVP